MASGTWDVVGIELRTRGLFDLNGRCTRAVRNEGGSTVRAVRAAWLRVEVSSSRGGHARPDRSTGLRARVAAATRAEATPSGVKITVDPARVDPVWGRALPGLLDASGRPWRHPVFGHRVWTVQRGQEVFYSTISAREPRFRAGIERAMEEAARQF